MSVRSGKKETLRECATYDENDTWYPCPNTIKMWKGADQLRLYLDVQGHDVGTIEFKAQILYEDGTWYEALGNGSSWSPGVVLAGEKTTLNLNGGGFCQGDEVKVFFRCSRGAGAATVCIYALAHESTPWVNQFLESNGGHPVNVQDQTTQAFDFFFVHPTQPNALTTSDVVKDTYVFTVGAGSGIIVGDYVGLFYQDRFFFAEVQTVTGGGTTITVDTPIDYAYPSGSTVLITSRDANVDGSTSSVTFQIGPVFDWQDNRIDITRIMFYMLDDSAMDDGRFGGIVGGLTDGIVLRSTSDGETWTYFNIKTNGEFGIHAYDTDYSFKAPAGLYGFRCRYTFAGQSKHGVAVRLSAGDTMELIIQDDLSELTSFRILAEGHIVD